MTLWATHKYMKTIDIADVNFSETSMSDVAYVKMTVLSAYSWVLMFWQTFDKLMYNENKIGPSMEP